MNKRVAARIRAGRYRQLNLLQVDHVCDHGENLAQALHAYVLAKLPQLEEKLEAPLEPEASSGLAAGHAWPLLAAPPLLGLGVAAVASCRHGRSRRSADASTAGAGVRDLLVAEEPRTAAA
mmetsp:Transcript_86135/g.267619  ORF Transcript_86135/g.267619 Transcript_86135/m.267619 type:complete len:121 (+) Transcript_86135:690-1052(+)